VVFSLRAHKISKVSDLMSGLDNFPPSNSYGYINMPAHLNTDAERFKSNYFTPDFMDLSPNDYLKAIPAIEPICSVMVELDNDQDGPELADDADDEGMEGLNDALADLTLVGENKWEQAEPTHRMGSLLAAAFSIYSNLKNDDVLCG
jgi:hypothetical protein